jgi:signal transduction histidine kinase
MMFTSLRTRLWLSYALLVGMVLCVVGFGLLFALVNSPLANRAIVLRLRTAEAAVLSRLEARQVFNPTRDLSVIQREAQRFTVRIAILDENGKVILDTGGNDQALPKIPQPLKSNNDNLATVSSGRDALRRVWLYTLRELDVSPKVFLVVSTQRPRQVLALVSLLTDELVGPLLEAGGAALLAAFVLALLMGRWIAAPLQRIADAAHRVAAGEQAAIPLEGPFEVQELSKSINEMTQKVKAGQDSQREFVANVSHELKTPLTSIQGFAQAIQDGTASSPESLHQAAEVIQNESARMYRLVVDLLALARLEAGTANLQSEPIDLTGLLHEVVRKFGPQASQAQVTLEDRIQPLPILLGDADRLAQVFSNLVDNALKFTAPGGRVSLLAEATGSHIEVKVSDTGVGISLEDQLHIFERFYQVDKSRRGGPGRGVGLGLAIARQIIEAQGGTIQIYSIPGRGTDFIVFLPCPAAQSVKPVEDKEKFHPRPQKTA